MSAFDGSREDWEAPPARHWPRRFIIAASVFLAICLLSIFAAAADPTWPSRPDPALTPGKVATTDLREVCAIDGDMSYSRRHRTTTAALKSWVFREYGIEPPNEPAARGEWEIDHLVPLCLGGADEAANLWPQNKATSRKKDRLEAQACREVCAGRLSLSEAQGWFRADWTAVPN
jgi:hypothetical protein